MSTGLGTLGRAIDLARSQDFRLGADSSVNDVWRTVDFGDEEFEAAVVRYFLGVVSKRYTRLQGPHVHRHC